MFYANSFLLRQRDRDLGLYNMLGMTKNNLRQILLFEKLFLYLVSVLVGLILGTTFIKLAFIILRNLLNNYHLYSKFSLDQLMQTFVFFRWGFLVAVYL